MDVCFLLNFAVAEIDEEPFYKPSLVLDVLNKIPISISIQTWIRISG